MITIIQREKTVVGCHWKVLKFISLSCCGLRSQAKRGIFNAIIYEQKPDIILWCESHLDSSYNSSKIFPAGFTVIRKQRVGGGGGGVFILFKQDLPLLEEPFL